MSDDLSELIARVEGLEGADREVDRDLTELAYPDIAKRETRVSVSNEFAWHHPEYGRVRCEPITASLDAALALVERVLPGALRSMSERNESATERSWMAEVYAMPALKGWRARAPTPALALILALLRALAVKEKDRGE